MTRKRFPPYQIQSYHLVSSINSPRNSWQKVSFLIWFHVKSNKQIKRKIVIGNFPHVVQYGYSSQMHSESRSPVFLPSTGSVKVVKSLDKCSLQVPQETQRVPVLLAGASRPGPGAHTRAEQLPTDTPTQQQQAVEVLSVQEPVQILQEESLTKPAELSCSMLLHINMKKKKSKLTRQMGIKQPPLSRYITSFGTPQFLRFSHF